MPQLAILQVGNLRAQTLDCLTRGHTTGKLQPKSGPRSPGSSQVFLYASQASSQYWASRASLYTARVSGFVYSFILETATKILLCVVLRPHDEKKNAGSAPAQVPSQM